MYFELKIYIKDLVANMFFKKIIAILIINYQYFKKYRQIIQIVLNITKIFKKL